jgi:tRNA(Ile)-lysidine synthase
MPEEIRLRLLLRAIDRFGHEGPAELGKVEALLAVFDRALRPATGNRQVKRQGKHQVRLKQTLAGAVISLSGGRIVVGPAPPRRR